MNVIDQSDPAALVDLVESGANLLNTVNYLLKDVRTVSEISGSRKCTSTSMYVSSECPAFCLCTSISVLYVCVHIVRITIIKGYLAS